MAGMPKDLDRQIDWLDQWFHIRKYPSAMIISSEELWLFGNLRVYELRPGVMDATSKLAKSD